MANQSCRQPSLDEILADPITVLMMKSDGVSPAEVRLLLQKAQAARLAREGAADGGEPAKRSAWMQSLYAVTALPVLDMVCRHCRT